MSSTVLVCVSGAACHTSSADSSANGRSQEDHQLTMIDTSSTAGFLERMRSLKEGNGRSRQWPYSCIEDFLLQHGQLWGDYQPLPAGIKAVKQKPSQQSTCFMNATKLAVENPQRFVYVEGVANMGFTSLITEHAWCIDLENNNQVVDVTWREGLGYFGAAFNCDYVMSAILRNGWYGLLDRPESPNRWPLLTGQDPAALSLFSFETTDC